MITQRDNTANKSSLPPHSTLSTIRLSIREHTLAFKTASRDNMILQLQSWLDQPATCARSIGYLNPHVFNLSLSQPEVRDFLSRCDLVCIDGIGVSLALRCQFGIHVHRVVAEEMFNAFLDTPTRKANAVLIGVENSEVRDAMDALNKLNNGLTVIGACDGFQRDEQYAQFLQRYNDIDLVLIGAGTPKSESIAKVVQRSKPHAICWHIGAGTIKTWAGTKKRAPALVSRIGLQWLHRILLEPHTRTRYLSGGIQFFKNLYVARLQHVDRQTLEWSEPR